MKSLQTDSEILALPPFGRLKIIGRAPKGQLGRSFWLCQCECGTIHKTTLSDLRKGRTTSCGCFQAETLSKKSKTHGKAETPEYYIWCGMKARCLNRKNKGYPRYGGIGIKVFQEWIDSFQAFLDHIGPIPKDGKYSLDRIISTGNYEPGNVRWATKETQANNTKSNVFITAFGRTQTLAQWSRETGIDRKAITTRINLLNWTTERALTERVGTGRRKAAPVKHEPFNWCG